MNGGLNTNYQYGTGDQGAPTIISAADGIAFVAGDSIQLQYLSGLVTPAVNELSTYPYVDANGETSQPAPDNSSSPGFGIAPSYYMPSSTYPIYFEELVGTFADSSGKIIGTPFAIGDSATIVVPIGATQLQLGVNDAGYSNDGGTLSIEVSNVPQASSPAFVAPGAQVQVLAQVQSALNQQQSDSVSYVLVAPSGTTVFASTPVPLAPGITSLLTTVDLGTLDTTGLPQGAYTLVATIF